MSFALHLQTRLKKVPWFVTSCYWSFILKQKCYLHVQYEILSPIQTLQNTQNLNVE